MSFARKALKEFQYINNVRFMHKLGFIALATFAGFCAGAILMFSVAGMSRSLGDGMKNAGEREAQQYQELAKTADQQKAGYYREEAKAHAALGEAADEQFETTAEFYPTPLDSALLFGSLLGILVIVCMLVVDGVSRISLRFAPVSS